MDILTAKGQETLKQEERAIEIWKLHFPVYSYIQTPKEKAATVDAVFSVDGTIKGVVETKCRNFSMEEFKREFSSDWLVTYDKLIKASNIASAMCVPLVGFLYLVKDDLLLYQKLWEPGSGWVCDMSIRQTWTQMTVNGGRVARSNAYINMAKAIPLKGE